LDLMWHMVLMRMQRRRTTRSSGASTGLAGVGSWTSGHGSTAVARSLQCERKSGSDGSEIDCDGGRRRRMGSTPPQVSLFIGGSTESIRCGSFHHTTSPNGSIPRSSRED
jgi:hypothetical protein